MQIPPVTMKYVQKDNREEVSKKYEPQFKKLANRTIVLFSISCLFSLGNLYYQENINQESLNNKNPHILENILGLTLPQSSVFAYAIINARKLRKKRDSEITLSI